MLTSGRAEFAGHDGQTLAARVDLPAGKPTAWVVFAHCFSCSKDIHAARRIAEGLKALGYGVFRFDFTGLGQSDGDFANTNFSSNVQDLIAASTWLQAETQLPQVMVGHSLGGAAAIVAAGALDWVKAVVTLGAPADAEHVLDSFAGDVSTIEAEGVAEVKLAGRPFTIKKQFIDDVRGAAVRDAAANLRRPLLIAHSPIDQTVGIENATGLFVAAKHPKSFISLDTADHLLSAREDAVFVADMIGGWAARYVATAADQPAISTPTPVADHDTIFVTETGKGPFEVQVQIGDHLFLADEPSDIGGADSGPDPYELVSSGLGACTVMTLNMYARRKGWEIGPVSVAVTHEKTHAEDCAHCEEGRKVDVFTRKLRLGGDLDADQKARLLEIADKCPVHKTLEAPGLVRTELAE